MSSTTFFTIDTGARSSLITQRDAIQSKYGIKMFFPRDGVRGQFQDVTLVGGSQSVFSAQKEIRTVINDWQDRYAIYKKHKQTRTTVNVSKSCPTKIIWPTLHQPSVQKSNTIKNPFSVLLEDDVTQNTTLITTPVKRTTKKTNTLTGWNKIAANKPTYPSDGEERNLQSSNNTSTNTIETPVELPTLSSSKTGYFWGDDEDDEDD